MGSTRATRLAALALGAGAVLVVAALVWSFLSPGTQSAGDDPDTAAVVPGTPLHQKHGHKQSRHEKGKAQHKKDGRHGSKATGLGASAGGPASNPASLGGIGSLDIPGLPGSGYNISAPAHHLVLRVTSDAPIGLIGYTVPTSADKYSGKATNVGTSWSMSTTVYGKPDYARLWAQAGARGLTVTCTVIVDGKVTDQRSTAGPYGAIMCQG